MENQNTNNTLIKVSAVAGVVILLSVVVYIIFVRPRMNFSPTQAAVTCEVHVDKTPLDFVCKDEYEEKIDLSKLFLKNVVDSDYVKAGNGFTVTVTKFKSGKQLGSKPLVFDLPVKTDYGQKNPQRKQEVMASKELFEEFLARAGSKEPVIRVVDYFLDDTSGVDQVIADKVGKQIKDFVADVKASGDKLDLTLYTVTDSAFVTVRNFKSDQPNFDAELNKQLAEDFLQVRGPRDTSSIASTLIQALAKNKDRQYREVILVTDGIENVPGKVSLLPNGPQRSLLMDREKWNELSDLMFGKPATLPELSGVSVTLIALPNIPKAEEKAVQNAFAFWTEKFFTPAKAAMQTPRFER